MQWVPTISIKTRIRGSFGNYVPPPYNVGDGSTRRVPPGGTISSVFSFINVMESVPSLREHRIHLFCLLIWAFCSHHAFLFFLFWFGLIFFYLSSFLCFSLVLRNLGQYVGKCMEMMATTVIITKDNSKERNIDRDLLLKAYCVLRAFQVWLSTLTGTLQGYLHVMSKETEVQRIEATSPRLPNK